jgi:hypothetical protein
MRKFTVEFDIVIADEDNITQVDVWVKHYNGEAHAYSIPFFRIINFTKVAVEEPA